ncbi:MAG: hypothetical protein DYH16_10245 [Nitrosomonas sp. PRO5]|nr:hypothetical protein [Nitrosomonas sp. PRO5]
MKKTAFILSVILILLVAVMALIALFSEIEGDGRGHKYPAPGCLLHIGGSGTSRLVSRCSNTERIVLRANCSIDRDHPDG